MTQYIITNQDGGVWFVEAEDKSTAFQNLHGEETIYADDTLRLEGTVSDYQKALTHPKNNTGTVRVSNE
jgi:hypothetical protein